MDCEKQVSRITGRLEDCRAGNLRTHVHHFNVLVNHFRDCFNFGIGIFRIAYVPTPGPPRYIDADSLTDVKDQCHFYAVDKL